MVNENSNTKIAGKSAQPKVSKIIFFSIGAKNQYQVYLVRSPKYWSLVGGKDGLLQEIDEEVYIQGPDAIESLIMTYEEDKPVEVSVLLIPNTSIHPNLDYEILEGKWVDVNLRTHEIAKMTGNFWKDEVVLSYIQRYLKTHSACKYCGFGLTQGYLHYVCELENAEPNEDGYWDDDHDECDEPEEGPCDDCDDRKMPYAARSCEECPHGGKGCLGILKVDELDFDKDDDYILDMWGPNAVNSRHNK